MHPGRPPDLIDDVLILASWTAVAERPSGWHTIELASHSVSIFELARSVSERPQLAVLTVDDAPRTVRVAGALVALQGLAGLVFVVVLLVGGVSGPGNNVYGEAAYFAVLTAGVLTCAGGLLLGKRWARSPSAVVQLLLGGVGWYAAGPSGRPDIGIPLLAFCVLTLVLMFTASARAWSLGITAGEMDDTQ